MTEETSIRAFIAVEIGQPVRKSLGELQERLKRARADVRWVRPEGIHLTLRFLGNISEGEVARLEPVLAATAAGQAATELVVSGWGTFPNPRRPRVVWVGLPEAEEKLGGVAEALEKNLIGAGFGPADKPWKPHLTLGRVQSSKGMDALLKALAEEGARDYGRIPADRLTLFQSRLQRGGAVYTVLKEVHFAATG